MKRRSFLTGVASAAIIPVVGLPAIASPTRIIYYNREGIGIEVTQELINDMKFIYKLTPDQIIEEMFGTEFHVRIINKTEYTIIVKISTNDDRDVLYKRYFFIDEQGTIEPEAGSWIRNNSLSDKQFPLLPFRNKTNEVNYKLWAAELSKVVS